MLNNKTILIAGVQVLLGRRQPRLFMKIQAKKNNHFLLDHGGKFQGPTPKGRGDRPAAPNSTR